MSLSRPAISIITPTYNRRAALERAIRSVQTQTFGDYEHIVIDDCSQDGTKEFVRGLDDPRIRYHRFRHWRGANPARNAGIELARSEWLTFLDSDDEFLPHRLAATAAVCREFGAPDLFISSFRTIKRGRQRAAANPALDLSGAELERALMTQCIFIAGSSITVRRGMLQQAGGFNPHLRRLQDREVLLRLSRHCGARLLAEVDWIKHPSDDSISGARHGYVAAMGDLVAAHPDLAQPYRDVIAYHLARRVLADLVRGRIFAALRSLGERRRCPALKYSLTDLVRGYLAGSAQRRAQAAELRWHKSGRPPSLSQPLLPERQLCETAALSRAA